MSISFNNEYKKWSIELKISDFVLDRVIFLAQHIYYINSKSEYHIKRNGYKDILILSDYKSILENIIKIMIMFDLTV